MKWILQYTGILRQLRLLHWLNNLSSYRALMRNRKIYQALGIKRSIFRSIDSRILSKYLDIENPPEFLPVINSKPASLKVQEYAQRLEEDGFIILKGHFKDTQVDRVNRAVQSALENGSLHYNYTNRKVFNAHAKLEELKQITHDPEVLEILEAFFGRPAILFQTISFTRGSEQQPHSDSIHMTTVPLGNLAGVWVALEEIDDDNGPLTYYPGSHKLPYIFNCDYGNSSTALILDGKANAKYEQKVAEVIKTHGLKKKVLHIGPGDVLIWHANLLHGGAPIRNPQRSRKSMVSHYFAKDVLCFHEISERPAILTT